MMMGRPLCVVLLVAVTASVSGKITDRRGPLNLSFSKMAVFNEESCLKEGGICVDKEDCPEDKLSEKKGLCPEQQKRGVECCHGAPRSLTDCRGLGGVCSRQCNKEITIDQAEDCTEGTVCCALVN